MEQRFDDELRVPQTFTDHVYVTETSWDDQFRPVRTVLPTGAVTEVRYDARGHVVWQRGPDGVITETVTSPQGVALEERRAGVLVQRTDVDALGRPVRQYAADGTRKVELSYDAVGRLWSMLSAENKQIVLAYDARGLIDSLTLPDGDLIDLTFDDLGREIARTQPGRGTTGQERDAVGRITALVDPHGARQEFGWREDGVMASYTDKLGHTESYFADEAGRVYQRTNRRGQVLTLDYDDAGRLSAITGPDVQRSWSYDALGRQVYSEADGHTITRTWSPRGLVAETSDAAGPSPALTLAWERDPAGRKMATAGPAGRLATRYDYDLQGRLRTVRDALVGLESFVYDYDLRGRPRALERPDGVITTWSWTATSRPDATFTTDAAGAPLWSSDLDYDAQGLIAQTVDPFGVHTWQHDDAGRLTGADHPAASGLDDETYAYDDANRRTAWAGHPEADVVYNAGDQLVQDARYTYAWDDDGNRISRTDRQTGAVTTYRWSALNQLQAVVMEDGSRWEFGYDADERRVLVRGPAWARVFVYDDKLVRSVLDEGGVEQASYVTGFGFGEVLAEVATRVTWPVRDALGTPMAEVSADDGAVTPLPRDAYGVRAAPTDVVPYGYTGHAEDPTGLVWGRARYLEAGTGQWLSEDPVFEEARYAYAAGQPDLLTDIDGRSVYGERIQASCVAFFGAKGVQLATTSAIGMIAEVAQDAVGYHDATKVLLVVITQQTLAQVIIPRFCGLVGAAADKVTQIAVITRLQIPPTIPPPPPPPPGLPGPM